MDDALVAARPADRASSSDASLATATIDDEHLAARGHNDEAFGELYRRWRAPAFRLARRYALNDDEATDIVANAFERAYVSIGSFNPMKGRFAAWVLRITHNVAVDSARQRARYRREFLDTASTVPRSAGDPEASAIERYEMEAVARAVRRLSLVEQEALALRYGASLTAREIGVVLGKRQAASEKLLSRSIEKLRKELADGDR